VTVVKDSSVTYTTGCIQTISCTRPPGLVIVCVLTTSYDTPGSDVTWGAEVVVGRTEVEVELKDVVVGGKASAPKSGVEGATRLDEVGLSIKAPPDWNSDEEVGLGVDVDVEGSVDVEDEIMADVVVAGLAVLTT
jgi:hypothetical protein